MEYIAFDAHKRYTLASVVRPDGQLIREQRIAHQRGALREFLERCEPGSPVAVETIGNWYWIVDEIEAAGCVPKLVHARKAKLMMGEINKTDRLDVRGLNRLQQAGTLPTVWIPPGDLRDQRDLPRTRMVFVRQRTQLKNRIHATVAKYALHDLEVTDPFGVRGRLLLRQRATPRADRESGSCGRPIGASDPARVHADAGDSVAADVAGGGADAGRGARPRDGGHHAVCHRREAGQLCGDHPARARERGKTRYRLKWAFVKAANAICLTRGRTRPRHVSRLYERVARRKGHAKAIMAVARHLAEATYWMLRNGEAYRESKAFTSVRPRGISAEVP